MSNYAKKRTVVGLCVAVCAVVAWMGVGQARAAEEVSLGVAIAPGSSAIRLALTIANTGKKGFRTTAIYTKRSRLVIRTPDGREIEQPLLPRTRQTSRHVVVMPSKSRTWTVDVSEVLQSRKLTAAGTYRVGWRLDKLASETIPLSVAPVALSISVVEKSSPTKFAFTLTNNGKTPFHTTLFGTNANVLIIVCPDGTRRQFGVSKDWPAGAGRVTIGPSKTRTWQIDVAEYLYGRRVRSPGTYRIYWNVNGIKSPGILVVMPKADPKKNPEKKPKEPAVPEKKETPNE